MTTTPPLRIRRALLDIPERLEQLRVGTIPTLDELADEPIAANVLNPTVVGSFNNSLVSFLSPTPSPSPDEIVIRQKGRRRISLTWSPEKIPSQRTPIKSVSTSTMVLRSSPRKRLMLNNDSTSQQRNAASTSSTMNTSCKDDSRNDDDNDEIYSPPNVKRMRFNDSCLAQTNTNVPIPVMLKGLSQDQLIQIIKDMIQVEPNLEDKLRDEFPFPDLSCFEEQLIRIKKNIFKSLPSSRLSPKTDGIAYSRASTHLSDLKKAIVQHCHTLNDSKHWDALIDYIDMAWKYVRATPTWDNHSHNAGRRYCFKVLSYHCAAALNNGGIRLGQERLNILLRNIKIMSKDFDDIKSCCSTIHQVLSKF